MHFPIEESVALKSRSLWVTSHIHLSFTCTVVYLSSKEFLLRFQCAQQFSRYEPETPRSVCSSSLSFSGLSQFLLNSEWVTQGQCSQVARSKRSFHFLTSSCSRVSNLQDSASFTMLSVEKSLPRTKSENSTSFFCIICVLATSCQTVLQNLQNTEDLTMNATPSYLMMHQPLLLPFSNVLAQHNPSLHISFLSLAPLIFQSRMQKRK